MITDTILDVLTSLAIFFIDLLPTWTLPSWWLTAIVAWSNIVAGISDLAHWVPLDAVATVFAAVVATTIFAFAVQILRIVASFMTGGGGKA